jgi:hypothetical protein
MLTAIDFDDQLAFETHKVNYIAIYRVLPPEFDSGQIAISEQLP